MKDLKRSLLRVLILGFCLSVAPVFAASDNNVGQDIITEAKPVPENKADQHETGKPVSNGKGEKSGDTDKPINLASKSLEVCGKDGKGCSQIVSFLLVFYLFVLVLGRLLWVVEPNNQFLKTHADRIEIRLDVEHGSNTPHDEKIGRIKEYLKKVRSALNRPLWTWSLAFTGRQMSAWRSLHEAERLAIDFYSPEVVKDQANLILDRLRVTQTVTTTLEDELRKGLEEKKDLRALVKEAKAVIYRDEDEQFEALADAQNKALWLVLVAVMILFGLSWMFPQAQILFLVGAAGGLLARLRKVVKTRSLPFDYGLSWTVLFLTPLVGALTAWAGTLLFVLLQAWDLIGVNFKGISITDPTFATLMVALVFGFSATLFEKFVEELEESISKKANDGP